MVRIAQWKAFLLLAQQARVLFSAFPIFLKKIDDAKIYRQHTVQRVDSAKLNNCSQPYSTKYWQASTTKKL